MPQDIRSYFAPVAASKKNSESVSKPQKRRVISSDEEDKERPKTCTKRSKIVKRAKETFISADSVLDDEIQIVEIDIQNSKQSKIIQKAKKTSILSDSEDEITIIGDDKRSPKRSKIVQKTKKTSILSDSEDEITIVENNKKDHEQSQVRRKNADKKFYKAISPGDLFSKKPVMRVEETKVSRKLQKLEAEFHDDDDFNAVLKQLDSSQNAVTIQKTKKDQNSTKKTETDISKDSKVIAETDSNKTKNTKYNASMKDSYNETNETEIKKMKRSTKNNSTYSEVVEISPVKHKLQKDKKSISSTNEELSDKRVSNTSEKSNYKPSASASTSKNEETRERLADKRKAKEVELFEERIENKKQRAILYEKYLQRGGARNPGSKEIPTGAKNCLAGVSFLLTGVFDSLERNEAEDLIRNYGGRTVNSVSGKVNYIVVGDEAGPAKLAKAKSLGIKQISEDNLLEMIRTRPEGKSNDIKPVTIKAKPNEKKVLNKPESAKPPSPNKANILSTPPKIPPRSYALEKTETSPSVSKKILDMSNNSQEVPITSVGSQPLVEKYRPKTLKQIIGQQGDRSCAHNLHVWLRDWHKNRRDTNSKNSNYKQINGQNFKAALLSGPPGVGKTTTAQVVCKELGYDILEFNASDTRSKTLLKEEVSGLLSNTTMKDYFTGTKQKITNKHVLLMDEVDGMAGNEDRGGLQELVNLIKHTDVPIICTCNDRYNMKMKTLSYHTYDLRFPKLRVEQIRSYMKSLCFKENIKISTEDLDRLIESTNYDIRQVINHLDFLSGKTAHVEATGKKHSNKNFKLGPFDVAKMIFSAENQKNTNLNEQIDLYFHDYNIAPLFAQENYLSARLLSTSPRQRLEKLARAADSISQGDLIEKVMRSSMMWSLLPMHACFSFVVPGNEMSGSLDSMPRFPSWFPRNSKATRFNRLMQELTTHMRLATGANKDAINLDYLIHVRNAIMRPLINNGTEGIEAALNVMRSYYLMREDLDSISEISLWPGMHDPASNLESKVKAAFTRAYQKNAPMLPYVINNNATAKKKSSREDDAMEEEEDDDEEQNDITSDKMIKVKRPTAVTTNKATTSTKKTGEPSKKRGRGRGKVK